MGKFALILCRDTFLVTFRRNLMVERFKYVGPITSLSTEVNDFRKKVAETCDNQFFYLSYSYEKEGALFKHYISGSQFFQMLKWYFFTCFGYIVSKKTLNRYYNTLAGRNYCGLLKLNNADWLKTRSSHFDDLKKLLGSFEGKSYLEFGGSSGVLALYANFLGFKTVHNFDLNKKDVTLCNSVAKTLNCSGLDSFSDMSRIESLKYDVISCHQVLEHTPAPHEVVAKLRNLMHDNSLLVLSHGYALEAYPGHINLPNGRSIDDLIAEAGLSLKMRCPGDTRIYEKRVLDTPFC